jgi:hypothetical protein
MACAIAIAGASVRRRVSNKRERIIGRPVG